MWPDRLSNLGPLTYESGALPTALRDPALLKDCLPYLFHGFRNKYFNKISLDNMLFFQNK